jgi:hypothetical protein
MIDIAQGSVCVQREFLPADGYNGPILDVRIWKVCRTREQIAVNFCWC